MLSTHLLVGQQISPSATDRRLRLLIQRYFEKAVKPIDQQEWSNERRLRTYLLAHLLFLEI